MASVQVHPADIRLKPRQPFHDEEATRKSNAIDEDLKKENSRRKDAVKREVKVMLLGQADAGKSTLRKQFQLYYTSQAMDNERPSWRPAVYFNIIKAVRMILDELVSDKVQLSAMSANTEDDDDYSASISLRRKLRPLVALEESLASELSGGVSVTGARTEAFVRVGWQHSNRIWPTPGKHGMTSEKPMGIADLAAMRLADLHWDIDTLWRDPSVKALIRLRKLRLDESAPFFLDNIRRVSDLEYIPTTEDVLNVRLQTLGITEHSFKINHGVAAYNWLMYDVGGARGQRQAWVSYFDDATAIIFLSPISAFDQYLEEDRKTNRIDDSLQLFSAICSNKLLRRAQLVLLLNKIDLLKKKLDAGIKVRKYVTSFNHRPNTYEHVSEYFRAHFMQVQRSKDPFRRQLFVHFTSMIDIRATQYIIVNVGEAILRSHIESVGLV